MLLLPALLIKTRCLFRPLKLIARLVKILKLYKSRNFQEIILLQYYRARPHYHGCALTLLLIRSTILIKLDQLHQGKNLQKFQKLDAMIMATLIKEILKFWKLIISSISSIIESKRQFVSIENRLKPDWTVWREMLIRGLAAIHNKVWQRKVGQIRLESIHLMKMKLLVLFKIN